MNSAVNQDSDAVQYPPCLVFQEAFADAVRAKSALLAHETGKIQRAVRARYDASRDVYGRKGVQGGDCQQVVDNSFQGHRYIESSDLRPTASAYTAQCQVNPLPPV